MFVFLLYLMLGVASFPVLCVAQEDACALENEGTDPLKPINVLKETTGFFEALTGPALEKGLTIMSKAVTNVCSKLPVIGAGFAVLGSFLEIFGHKEPSQELMCMKQEFDKINEKLDKINTKLNEMDKKLDAMLEAVKQNHIVEEYNQEFKNYIHKTYSSYHSHVKTMTSHSRESLLESCYTWQPIHALDWLVRTMKNTASDPAAVQLLQFIFDDPNCDGARAYQWMATILEHVSLAASMHIQCYATALQNQTLSIDDAMAAPGFKRTADHAAQKVAEVQEMFRLMESGRQEACFERIMQKWSDDKEFDKRRECTCKQLSKDQNVRKSKSENCPSVMEMIGRKFDVLQPRICIGRPSSDNTAPTTKSPNRSIVWSSDKTKAMLPFALRNPWNNEGTLQNLCLDKEKTEFTFTTVHIFVTKTPYPGTIEALRSNLLREIQYDRTAIGLGSGHIISPDKPFTCWPTGLYTSEDYYSDISS